MEQNIFLNNILIPEMNANLHLGLNALYLKDPIQSGALLPKDHVILNNAPCQILDVPEVTLKLRNIYTGEISDLTCPSTNTFTVPVVTSEYYQVLALDDNGTLTLQKFDDDSTPQRRVRVNNDNLVEKVRHELEKVTCDTYCTIVKAFGVERLASIRSCPSFPDFYRLPVEMVEKVFSFLPKQDLLSARAVCRSWNDVIPISSIVQINTIKICGGKIITRLQPPGPPFLEFLRPPWHTRFPTSLADFGPDLVQTVRHLQIREPVATPDLEIMLEQCSHLHSLDLDYPTHDTMQALEQLVSNNEETLVAFHIWDYFWYNSQKDAFDCGILSGCHNLGTLSLFVRHIKSFETIPVTLSHLKLDFVSVEEIRWILKNLKGLKCLRFEVTHEHYAEDSQIRTGTLDGCQEGGQLLDTGILRELVNLPKMEKLDLNFSRVPRRRALLGQCCPALLQFQALCNSQDGVEAFSDTWDTSCTLEISIDRGQWQGFGMMDGTPDAVL